MHARDGDRAPEDEHGTEAQPVDGSAEDGREEACDEIRDGHDAIGLRKEGVGLRTRRRREIPALAGNRGVWRGSTITRLVGGNLGERLPGEVLLRYERSAVLHTGKVVDMNTRAVRKSDRRIDYARC